MALLGAACNDPPVEDGSEAVPVVTLPSAAPGAVGAYLPTARGAGSRIPIISAEPRSAESVDGGLPELNGQGVPL